MNHRFGADVFVLMQCAESLRKLFAIYDVRFFGDIYGFPDQTACRFDEVDSCFEVVPFPFPRI